MSPADLAHLVVDPADERQRAAGSTQDVLLPQDLLPGSGEEATSLRDGLRSAGTRTFVILAIIVTLDNLQTSGLAVLAPNIQASFHVSTGAIVFVTGISGGFLVLGIVPMGWLADRFRRAPIVGWATFVFGLMVFATGSGCLSPAPRLCTAHSWRIRTPSPSAGGSQLEWGSGAAQPWHSAPCWLA